MEMRLGSLESDCVFRANDRMIFKLYLSSLHIDDLAEATLYPKVRDVIRETMGYLPKVYSDFAVPINYND